MEPSVSGVCSRPRILSSLGELPMLDPSEMQTKDIPNELHQDHWIWQTERQNPESVVAGTHVTFHPTFAFGTTGVKGMKRLTSTCIAYWEINALEKLYGTSVMFGIGTAKAVTQLLQCFADLLGGDSESYGLSHLSIAQHDGLAIRIGDPMPISNCKIGILFDGPARTLSYFVNGLFMATPFIDIDTSKVWYPMISSTAQQSHFIVQNQLCKYIAPELTELCIIKIRELLQNNPSVDLLLPEILKNRIFLSNERSRKNLGRVARGILLPEHCAQIVKEFYKRTV